MATTLALRGATGEDDRRAPNTRLSSAAEWLYSNAVIECRCLLAVILACRSLERGNSVKQRIQGKLAEAGLKPKLEVVVIFHHIIS